jgi:quercetin dioxygenase-like cupin family protein
MEVISGGEIDTQYGGLFTGAVDLEMLHATPSDDEPDIALVHFHDGAVTNWHHHPGGQRLFVVSGSGRVGTEGDGAVALGRGDLVVAPPDERHWHGAAAGAECTMLAITWGTTCWHEDVPDLTDG